MTRFYAHPYSFVRPDPLNPLSERVETANFIKSLGWSDPAARSTSTDYEQQKHRRWNLIGYAYANEAALMEHPDEVAAPAEAKAKELIGRTRWRNRPMT